MQSQYINCLDEVGLGGSYIQFPFYFFVLLNFNFFVRTLSRNELPN